MHSPLVVFSRTGTSACGRKGWPLAPSRCPGAAHETVHGQGHVASDPDPAVSDPQDQGRVQVMVGLREAVGPGEHHAREAEDETGDQARSDQVAAEELAARREPLAFGAEFRVVLIAAIRARTRARIRVQRLRLPVRSRLDLAQALEELVDVAVHGVARVRLGLLQRRSVGLPRGLSYGGAELRLALRGLPG